MFLMASTSELFAWKDTFLWCDISSAQWEVILNSTWVLIVAWNVTIFHVEKTLLSLLHVTHCFMQILHPF